MTWVVLAAATAVLYALHGTWAKRVAGRVGPLVAAWALFAFALPLLGAYLLVQGVPEIGPRFWPVLAVNCLLNLGAAYLFLSALDTGELGVAFPLLTLTPLFVVPLEFALLGQLPGRWGIVGILLVVSGIYLLNFSHRRLGVLAPFVALARSPGARRSLAVAVIWSVTGTLDRVAVLESSPGFYGTMLAGGLAILFLPAIWIARAWRAPSGATAAADATALARGRGGGSGTEHSGEAGAGEVGREGPGDGPGHSRATILLAVHGLLFAAMFIAQMEALDRALASYVLAIKRTGAILAVFLGWLFFRERALRHRLAGAAVTVAGVAVLIIWG